MGMNDRILIGKMANPVRERETMIMDAIFTHHPVFETDVLNPQQSSGINYQAGQVTIEGGDFQVARKDVFLVGTGVRTSTQGIDFILEHIRHSTTETRYVIVQELPSAPESFIHLDMIFTFLDKDMCMVYEPMIFGSSRYRTILIRIENHKVVNIREVSNIPDVLRSLGIDVEPVSCGGRDDLWAQEREQWHSGANFFAFAPGKIIGYERNNHTIEELAKAGFEVIKAEDIIRGKILADDYRKCVVTIGGSELARGGGGARCMTMPVKRAAI
jgi:arginine deiminase